MGEARHYADRDRTLAHLVAAQALTHVGSWDYELESGRLEWSAELFRIYGLPATSTPPAWEQQRPIFHPDDWPALSAAIRRCAKDGTPYALEVRVVRPNGEVRWVWGRGQGHLDEAGRVVRRTGTVQDVTERKRIEDALKESEARFRVLESAVSDVIWMSDLELARFTYLSPSFTRLTGYPVAEAMALGPRHFLAPRSLSESLDALRTELAKRPAERAGPVTLELELGTRDGPPRQVEVRADLVYTDGGPSGITGVARDVTERRALEVAAARSDRLASMGLLASAMSHEINNPVAYVLHNLERLEALTQDRAQQIAGARLRLTEHLGPETLAEVLGPHAAAFDRAAGTEVLEAFRDALAGARRIRDVVRDLGTFSRMDEAAPAGGVDLREAVEGALRLARHQLRYRARVETELGETPPVVGAVPRLAQVFINLLTNAAHALPEGDADANRVTVRTWAEGEDVFAEVSDTGRGIPKENLSRIFEPFFTTKPVGVGSGLGLNVARNLVTGYGGELEVRSEVGVGTTFRLRLPAAASSPVAEAEPRGTPSAQRAEAAGRARILVVDDEPALRRVLRRILRDHEVVEADSGAQARAILSEDAAFDLVLCDMMMPNVSGVDVHRWLIRERPALTDRFVFMTGGAFTPEARDYLEATGIEQLGKPFTAAELEALVARRTRDPEGA